MTNHDHCSLNLFSLGSQVLPFETMLLTETEIMKNSNYDVETEILRKKK